MERAGSGWGTVAVGLTGVVWPSQGTFGRQVGFGAEGGGLQREWKGGSACSGWHTLSLLGRAGPEPGASTCPGFSDAHSGSAGRQGPASSWLPSLQDGASAAPWVDRGHCRGQRASFCLFGDKTDLVILPCSADHLSEDTAVLVSDPGQVWRRDWAFKGMVGGGREGVLPSPQMLRSEGPAWPGVPGPRPVGEGRPGRHAHLPARRHLSPQTGLPAALSTQSTSVLPGGLTSGTRYLGGGGPGGDWEGPKEPGRAMNSRKPGGLSRRVAQGRLSFLTWVLGLPGTSGVRGSVHGQGWEPGPPRPGGCGASSPFVTLPASSQRCGRQQLWSAS